MAGTGSRRGSNNGGGMPKGHKTKKVLEREEIERQQQRASEAAVKIARAPKMAKDVLSEAMNFFFGLAALYQPSPANAQANEEKFEKYLIMSTEIAGKLAPYQSRRLASITHTQVPMDLSRLSDAELDALERLQRKATDLGGDTGGAGQTIQ